MGIVIKQGFWASIITYAGVLIGYVNSLILFPYFLDTESYGLVRLVQSNAMLLLPFGLMGMSGTFMKFFPQVKDDNQLKEKIFSYQMVIVTISFIFFSILVYIFRGSIEAFNAEKSNLYNDYIFVTLIIFGAQTLFNFFISYLWTIKKIILTNFVQEITLRLASTIVICLFGFEYISFSWMVILIGLTYTFTTLFIYLYLFWVYGFKFDWKFYDLDKTYAKAILKFGGFLMLASASSAIILNVTYPLTSSLLGLEASGILTISIFIGTIIELPKRALLQIITPIISQNFEENDISAARKNYEAASLNLGLLGFLIAIGIIINLDSLYQIIPKGETYAAGFWVIVIICVSKCISMIGGITAQMVIYSNFYKTNVIISIISSVLIVIFNLLLLPRYGIVGSAIGTLITTLLGMLIRQALILYKLKIHPYKLDHIKMIVMAIAVFCLGWYLPKIDQPILDIMYRSVIVSIVYISLSYVLKISGMLNYNLNSIFKKYL